MLTILHAQTRCRSVHARGFTVGQKNCGQSGLGHRASGPPGRRAAGPLGRRGPRAAGRGPRAVGRGPWAAGPSGRWAAGLLLAKPAFIT